MRPSKSWRGRRRTAGRPCSSACPGSRTASCTMPWRSWRKAGSKRCGSRSTCRITGSSTKSGCLRPDPRRARSCSRACASACRSARTSGGRTRSNASSRPAARSCSFPTRSPYERDKLAIRQSVAVARVVESGLPLIYLNLVGGQDELVFEGASFAPQRRPQPRRPAAGFPSSRGAHACGSAATTAGPASKARGRRSRRATRPIMPPA